MISKINKHYKILATRFAHSKQLQEAKSYDNALLNSVVDAMQAAKSGQFTVEETTAFTRCEAYRKKLKNDNTVISYAIFNSAETRTVAEICDRAASPPIWAQFMYKLTKANRVKNVLEIGTNLGISGCYSLEALKDKKEHAFVSLEGLEQLCKIAENQFSLIEPKPNFTILQGLYENTFDKALQTQNTFDLAFIDGNHQEKPTLYYFEEIKKKVGDAAILVFDDINWTKGMQRAWAQIGKDSDVNFAIDMYKLGIVIIDKKDSTRNKQFAFHLSYN